MFFLRHFHCVNNEVSQVGLKQSEFVINRLLEQKIEQVLYTEHPRVQNSVSRLSEFLNVHSELVLESDIDAISNKSNILFVSQQPILVNAYKLITGVDVPLTFFSTGRLIAWE